MTKSLSQAVTIRPYAPQDADVTWEIFYSTIRRVNIRDYTLAQVQVWAPDNFDIGVWAGKINAIQPALAEIDTTVVGYADLQPDGLIDHFFCHYQYQRQGVGRALMAHIHDEARKLQLRQLRSEVSITARPFYERMGFKVIEEQQIELGREVLTNFRMTKDL